MSSPSRADVNGTQAPGRSGGGTSDRRPASDRGSRGKRAMYRDHRRAFAEHLARTGAAALIPTATAKVRNADSEYRFRPDSDFWYLTGFAEPESMLVLLPDGEGPRSVLFLRDLDPEREVWTGRRLGVEAAPEVLGVDEAYPIESAGELLPDLLGGYERLVARLGVDPAFDRFLTDLLPRLRHAARANRPAPVELVDHAEGLHELRLKKSEAEIEQMRHALAITSRAHRSAMAAARPGMGEHEIEALLQYHFHAGGSTGPAYTNIVAGGANACILHYIDNDQPLRDGELLLIDAGAEWDYYASDVTRTFPINGRFSPEQRALYEVVLEAQLAVLDRVRPGATLQGLHRVALEHMVDGLLGLGLLRGDRDGVFADGSLRRFLLHKTSHWLGLDVHDCGSYATAGEPRPLEPGMVLTVEPGLYVAPDEEGVDEVWRGTGIRIEDDVLVTEDGCEVLSADIPKGVEEVEALCAGGAGRDDLGVPGQAGAEAPGK